MKKNLVPLLGIAFIVALISTGIFYGLVSSRLRTSSADTPKYTVVAASKGLVRGSVIHSDDLKLVSWTRPGEPKGVYTSRDQLVGLTVLDSVSENEPIAEDRIATHKSVPSGMRALSIHVSDSSGVVGLLRPGYKVDVQVVANRRGGEVGIRTVLQNVEVLNTAAPENGRPVVNLLVSPNDADLLGLADSTARIRLVLRNPADESRPVQSLVPATDVFRGQAENSRKPVSAPVNTPNTKISAVLPQR
jgi:Flp pilus assembly protein CpaB